MDRWIRSLALVAVAVIALGGVTAKDANAIVQEFFGEDLIPAGVVPPGGNAATARQNFLNELTAGVSTESFESFANGSTAPLALSFTGGLGTINATLNGGGSIMNAPGSGRFATSGSQYWNLQTNAVGFSIAFASPIAAFGFFATDIGDFNGSLTLQTSNGVVNNYVVPNTLNGANGSLLFYGLIDTDNPFTQVTFGNTATGTDSFGFDTLTVGDITQVTATPLPAALPLFLMALGTLGFVSRRRLKVGRA